MEEGSKVFGLHCMTSSKDARTNRTQDNVTRVWFGVMESVVLPVKRHSISYWKNWCRRSFRNPAFVQQW